MPSLSDVLGCPWDRGGAMGATGRAAYRSQGKQEKKENSLED